MNLTFITEVGKRTIALFVLVFILTLPNFSVILPDLGQIILPFAEKISRFFVSDQNSFIRSDSALSFVWLLISFIFCLFASIVWTSIKNKPSEKLYYWFFRIVVYYLALTLFVYGFHKVFKYQFPFPSPNELYTPMGNFSRSSLYWASMGTSYSYNVFSGLMEVIPALLLLFRKTRLLGAVMAFAVMVNVMMINFGFDISVKSYSIFLTFLCLIIIQPHFKRLYTFFFLQKTVDPNPEMYRPSHPIYKKLYSLLKSLVIGLLLLESLWMFFEKGCFNGDNSPKTEMFGAYKLDDNTLMYKRVFFHNYGHFITQSKNDNFQSYEVFVSVNEIRLTNTYTDKKAKLDLEKLNENSFILSGNFFGKMVEWKMYKINLKGIPLNHSSF